MGFLSTPELAVAREVSAIALDFVRLGWRLPEFWVEVDALRARLRHDLEADAPALAAVEIERAWPDRPLRIFVSWAEASGEIHATGLIRALRERARAAGAPEPEFTALGGRSGEDLGLTLIGHPADNAFMGFFVGFGALPYYLGLARDTVRHVRAWRPDVFVPVDSPSLHVPLGRLARRSGVPVVHFVTPQYWGWAPWRVHGYRSAITRALTILPFEPAWFARHGIPTAHVGHPLVDALRDVPATPPREDGSLLAILPGSRNSIVDRNLPWMLARFDALRRRHPQLRGAVVAANGGPTERVRAIVEGSRTEGIELRRDLHSTLDDARAAFSVSGTVLLDLLHHRMPAVVVYRLPNRREVVLASAALIPPYFSSVNLLAADEVYPEFYFAGDGPIEAVQDRLELCLWDAAWRRESARGLQVAAERLGPPGAIGRAADQVLDVALSAAEDAP